MKESAFTPELLAYLETIESEFVKIPEDRIRILKQITEFIDQRYKSSQTAELVFICTHNSRRSQFGQIWAATAAEYYGIRGLTSYSGGTEATSFNPHAVGAIKRAGFMVDNSSRNPDNPAYKVQTSEGSPVYTMFSKKYDDPVNPSRDHCAIMVCSDADMACPIIPNAIERISLPYEDPKKFDGTPLEILKYDERCREIARDIHYVLRMLR